ncbi:DUF3152 domain-containing protein [Streptomyces sp. NBC_01262]|uniref:DUF3152 domain-containing protein n=1 Tax=Streptomyces sp. NBC_01262 TaxID=2903803 RepID=UPI002E36493A|nr:DUF3152 domain-containing protein [Streptomyces sp. NBC_01262]
MSRNRTADRRRRKRTTALRLLAAPALLAAVICAAALAMGQEDGAQVAKQAVPTPSVSTSPAAPTASPSASPSESETDSAVSVAATATALAIPVPSTGPGSFRTASAGAVHAATAGKGTVLRYKVQVEKGIAVDADEAAEEVVAILADKRGWTANGKNGFKLVSSGKSDFIVKIATPGTVDKLCGAVGLKTYGKVNCRAGASVVVNLRRWVDGSPEFDGTIGDYHALIVNHEVGHRLGHGHLTCAGKGKLAPVMMQQIKGLKGCKANAWPYDEDGDYISGPAES